jgi:heat shock protein HtpX
MHNGANLLNDHIVSNIRGNRIQSGFLIFGMACVTALIGFVLGGQLGLGLAIFACIAMAFFAPRVSPQLVLKMYKAQEIPRASSPDLHNLFAELVDRAELPVSPRLYYIPSRTLNAFAVGAQRDSAVAITDGLLRLLNPREVAGVLAHEISHIRHKDMRVLGIADTVSRITGALAQIGQLMLFLAVPTALMNGGYMLLLGALLLISAPMLSNLMQLALSRAREFNADLGAVALTGDAGGLASALLKLERATAGGGFPWIFAGKKKQTVPAMLRTHPPTDERVRRIAAAGESLIAQQQALSPAAQSRQPRQRLAPHGQSRVRSGPRWHVAGLWY